MSDSQSRRNILDEFKWDGLRIPGKVFVLYLDGKINQTEMLLVSLIDAVAGVKGEGCWISNSGLAQTLGLKDGQTVSDMVSKLVKIGLLIRTGFKRINGRDQRIVETVWTNALKVVNVNTVGENAYGPPVQRPINSSLRSETLKQTNTPRRLLPFGVEIAEAIYAQEFIRVIKKHHPRVLLPTHFYPVVKKLRKKYSDSQVDQVISFLEKHGGETNKGAYCPLVRTANTLLAKFPKLLEAIKRHKENAASSSKVEVPDDVPDSVLDIVSDLKTLGWGSDQKDLVRFAHQTYQTYLDFRKRLRAYCSKLVKETGATRKDQYEPYVVQIAKNKFKYATGELPFVDEILQAAQDVSSFTRGWIRATHEFYIRRDKWKGKLLNLTPKIDSDRFTDYLAHSVPGIKCREWTELKETLYAD